MTTTTTTTTNTTAATTTDAVVAKQVQAFYQPKGSKGPAVSIFLNDVTKTPGTPHFSGTIDGKRIAMWIQKSEANGPFLPIKGAKMADGNYEELGMAHIRVNPFGIPKLAIKMNGTEGTLWAEVSKSVPHDVLIAAGFDLAKSESLKAEYAAKKSVAQAAQAAATETKVVEASEVASA